MTKDEVLRLALEALVAAYQGNDKTGQVTEAITAIKQALAQPEHDSIAMADYMALVKKYVALKAAHGIKGEA